MKIVVLVLFMAAAAAVPARKKSKNVDVRPIVMPEPEIAEDFPVPQGSFGEVFNDGNVQLSGNGPEDPSVFATLQSWFNMIVNYIGDSVISQQIA